MKDLVLNTIRIKRLEKKYSQEYMSSQLEISQSSYGRIENGKVPLNLEILLAIISILEIDFFSFIEILKESKSKLL